MDPFLPDAVLVASTASALAPVFLMLLVGACLRRSGFLDPSFWPSAERLTYYLLFPALLLTTISTADIDASLWKSTAAALLLSLSAVVCLLVGLRPLLCRSGPHFTSILQGGIRMNTYVGLAVASLRYGANGVALSAVAIVAIVPFVNLVCVIALACCVGAGGPNSRVAVRSVVGNPLILATVFGAILNLAGIGSIPIVTPTIEGFGRAALPMGLLTVGASLRWQSLRGIAYPEVGVTVIKLLGLPLLAAFLLNAMGVGGTLAAIAILFSALPTAPSSYLLAREMGGDTDVMVSLITLQTAVAAITLPLMLSLLT